MEKNYTIAIYTENRFGLLNHITIVFTRRRVNIESLTVSASEIEGVHRYSIVVNTTKDMAVKLVKQIEKIVEVLKAFVLEEEETIHQEIALYKVSTATIPDGQSVEKVIRDNHARILTVEPEYMVVEKTGHKSETQALLEKLETFGVLQFVRSGRVAISKPRMELSSFLKDYEKKQEEILV